MSAVPCPPPPPPVPAPSKRFFNAAISSWSLLICDASSFFTAFTLIACEGGGAAEKD